MTIEALVSIMFVAGMMLAPSLTGKRRSVFLAGTVAATMIAICLGNVVVLLGYGAGTLSGSFWRS